MRSNFTRFQLIPVIQLLKLFFYGINVSKKVVGIELLRADFAQQAYKNIKYFIKVLQCSRSCVSNTFQNQITATNLVQFWKNHIFSISAISKLPQKVKICFINTFDHCALVFTFGTKLLYIDYVQYIRESLGKCIIKAFENYFLIFSNAQCTVVGGGDKNPLVILFTVVQNG